MSEIAWIAGSGKTFAAPIMEALGKKGHSVRGPLEQWPPELPRPDLLWIEWADQAAVDLTNAPKLCPIVLRVHSFELFAPWFKSVHWAKVDAVIFVAEHVKEEALRICPEIGKAGKITVIPNGIDPKAWVEGPRASNAFPTFAWVGGISHKKGPDLFIAAALEIIEQIDENARFLVAGEMQDGRYAPLFRQLALMGFEKNFEVMGQVDHAKIRDVFHRADYVISTSPWESWQQAIAEGILCGCVPLVRKWPGAENVWPAALHWDSLDELCDLIRKTWRRNNSDLIESNRTTIRSRYRLSNVVDSCDALIRNVLESSPASPKVSLGMIARSSDPMLGKALKAVEGHVDEIVVALDMRSGDHGAKAACEAVGAKVIEADPILWHGHFDFSANRNRVAEACSHDWILVVDSDETVENPELIRPMVRECTAHEGVGVGAQVKCYLDTGLAEQSQDIRIYRKSKCSYLYPIHNQLQIPEGGGTLGTQISIRSTYVGGLQERVPRGIPPLEILWEQANSGTWSDDPKKNEAAKRHAAFFLCRMSAVASDHEAVAKWAKTIIDLAPVEKMMAPAWSWYARSALYQSGPEAAMAIIEEGFRHFPTHPDLAHIALTIWFKRWTDYAKAEKDLMGVPMATRHLALKAPEAAKLIGLPIAFKGAE